MAQAEVRTYEYLLDNKFFVDIDGDEVQKGKINISLRVERKISSFELKFHITGTVVVACDRCLDEMDVPIETDPRLIVKLGREYAEESDETLVISEDEGSVNLAWFLYEFVALAIPMKHIHAPGKCNKLMSSKLKKYAVKRSDDDDAEDFAGVEIEDIIVDDADDEPEQSSALED
jgi:uncharacterized metal-binding protein YceD (DUF177 family)